MSDLTELLHDDIYRVAISREESGSGIRAFAYAVQSPAIYRAMVDLPTQRQEIEADIEVLIAHGFRFAPELDTTPLALYPFTPRVLNFVRDGLTPGIQS